MSRQAWKDNALCKDLPTEQSDKLFFIGPGQTSKRARIFCASCPVKRECKEYAITYNEWGIWAGDTEDDRANLDPFIGITLREKARANGVLETHRVDDFIPPIRQPGLTQDEVRAATLGLSEEQSEALYHLSAATTYLLASVS